MSRVVFYQISECAPCVLAAAREREHILRHSSLIPTVTLQETVPETIQKDKSFHALPGPKTRIEPYSGPDLRNYIYQGVQVQNNHL